MILKPHKPPAPAVTLISHDIVAAGLLWRVVGVLLLTTGLAPAWSTMTRESDPIRREISQIQAQLMTLPVNPINACPWTLGYSSNNVNKVELPVTLTIAFAKPAVIDLIALLPATYTDDGNEVRAFGFPIRFSIERLLPDGSVKMLANHLETDFPEPGLEPQLFPCHDPSLTEGLRITITESARNPTWWQTSHTTALSEVFAFAEDKNIALNAKVTASASFDFSYIWSPACITDGFSLFSPIDHKLTNPMQNFSARREQVTLEMDLGENHEIDEFRLWPVVHSIQHNFPASSGVGFPQSFRLEIASSNDFSDATLLYDEAALPQRPGAGPLMHQVTPTAGRFLRLTLRHGLRDFRRDERVEITLSEIEFLENGQVVSGNKPVLTPGLQTIPPGSEFLTDGVSNEGRILPLRQWVTEFKQRVELERKLASLQIALGIAQSREEKWAIRLLLIALGLILALIQIVWLVRVAARRRWAHMRERIACDLHDEIGANVSSIAHTAELLDESIDQPSTTQARLLHNLIESARLTSRETKHFIRFIEGENEDRDMTEQIGRVTAQILGTIPVKASFQNTRSFNRLDPSTKWNLLLFFKEALNNIIKHAEATRVEITAQRVGSKMQLTVSDNGRGLPEDVGACRHLESRARILKGQMAVQSEPGGGTRVILTFKSKPQP